jgi:hypothetical protein
MSLLQANFLAFLPEVLTIIIFPVREMLCLEKINAQFDIRGFGAV